VDEWPLAISPNTIKIQRVKLRDQAQAIHDAAHRSVAD
jgi:hypothetical protein